MKIHPITRILRPLAAGLLISLVTTTATAQTTASTGTNTATASTTTADLAEIYNLAVRNDPQMGAAEATFLSRSQVVAQNRASLLPNISVSGSTSFTESETISTFPAETVGFGSIYLVSQERYAEYNSHNWRATLRQPVFRLDLWYRFQTAKRQRAEAAANFAAEQQELLVRVADSYFTILEQESRLDASNAERSAVQRQLEQVQQRFDVGLVAITDVLESQAAFDSATVNVIEAEGGQSTSFETLLRLTGRPHNAISGLAEDFPVKYPDPADEDAWVKAALSNNYSLKAAGERLQVARRSLHAARSRYLPQINADVSYSHNVSGGHRRDCTTALNDPALNASGSFVIPQLNRDGTPRLDSNGAPLVDVVDLNDCSPTNPGLPGNSITPTTEADLTVAQLSISMPIFQGGALRAGSKQAKYNLDAAQKNFDLQQRRTVETTKNLYLAVTTDVARVKARKRGIESSQSALDATQTGYEVGTRNIVDVLLAQQRLYLSQFQYASARYKYVRDTLRLKQAAGILNPDDLYDLNNYINDELIVTRTRASTR